MHNRLIKCTNYIYERSLSLARIHTIDLLKHVQISSINLFIHQLRQNSFKLKSCNRLFFFFFSFHFCLRFSAKNCRPNSLRSFQRIGKLFNTFTPHAPTSNSKGNVTQQIGNCKLVLTSLRPVFHPSIMLQLLAHLHWTIDLGKKNPP